MRIHISGYVRSTRKREKEWFLLPINTTSVSIKIEKVKRNKNSCVASPREIPADFQHASRCTHMLHCEDFTTFHISFFLYRVIFLGLVLNYPFQAAT